MVIGRVQPAVHTGLDTAENPNTLWEHSLWALIQCAVVSHITSSFDDRDSLQSRHTDIVLPLTLMILIDSYTLHNCLLYGLFIYTFGSFSHFYNKIVVGYLQVTGRYSQILPNLYLQYRFQTNFLKFVSKNSGFFWGCYGNKICLHSVFHISYTYNVELSQCIELL
jgi:hypothetical protein